MILTSELPSLQWSSHEIYDSVSPNPAGLSEQSIGWRWPFSDAPAGTRLDREGGGAQPGWHGPGQRPGHGDLLAGLQDVLLHMAWDLLDDLHLHHGCPTHQNHLILIGWLRSTPLCPWRNQPSSFCLIWSTWGGVQQSFSLSTRHDARYPRGRQSLSVDFHCLAQGVRVRSAMEARWPAQVEPPLWQIY